MRFCCLSGAELWISATPHCLNVLPVSPPRAGTFQLPVSLRPVGSPAPSSSRLRGSPWQRPSAMHALASAEREPARSVNSSRRSDCFRNRRTKRNWTVSPRYKWSRRGRLAYPSRSDKLEIGTEGKHMKYSHGDSITHICRYHLQSVFFIYFLLYDSSVVCNRCKHALNIFFLCVNDNFKVTFLWTITSLPFTGDRQTGSRSYLDRNGSAARKQEDKIRPATRLDAE